MPNTRALGLSLVPRIWKVRDRPRFVRRGITPRITPFSITVFSKRDNDAVIAKDADD